MGKLFSNFCFFIALFLISGNINAQFTATVQTDPTTEWCAGPDVKFKLSEVAAQMGCTTAQLVDKFEEWTAAANGDTNGYIMDGFFTLESGSATFFSEQYGGYEMNTNGSFAWWSGTSTWGVYIHYMDIETDELSFILCQNPTNPLGKDDVCHGIVALNLNGGKATFEFIFSVISKAVEDVNSDGSVDSQDVMFIYSYMRNNTSQFSKEQLDINSDGNVDTQDVMYIYKYMKTH